MTGLECNASTQCVFISTEDQVLGFGLCVDKVCVCGGEFGWTGEVCSEKSAQVVFMRFMLVLLPIIFFILFFWAVYNIICVLRLELPAAFGSSISKVNRQKKLRRSILAILFLTGIGTFCFANAHYNGIRSTEDPTRFEYTEDSVVGASDDDLILSPQNDDVYLFLEVIGIQFISFGTYATMSLLIELLKGVMYFSKEKKRINRLVRSKFFIDFLVVINIFIIFILLLAREVDTIYSISVLNTLILVILLIIGRIYLARVFREFKTNKELISGVFTLIRHQLIGYFLVLVSFPISLILGRGNVDGNISAGTFFYQIIFILLGWLATANLLYCRRAIKNLERQTSRTNSVSIEDIPN